MADRLTASAAKLLGTVLSASGKTLAVAESCTAGLLGGAVTSIPGSSLYFSGGVVAYGNSAKISLLGVPPDLISARGAVSREVALAMAEGVLSLFRADLAIAVTGIAGPGGGSRGKPVGTVWVAVVALGGVRHAHRFRFPGGREAVRRETVKASLRAAIDVLRTDAAEGS
ncbi:nicotinamide-nucleotide amidohydrolase family protein [Candidatus Deferrimicrobium sp.]|uniref:CinA family protein n=1 Tax=Candidatus Deferrimicrobium sp. TaxID=3060586 RepID=UPI002ED46145